MSLIKDTTWIFRHYFDQKPTSIEWIQNERSQSVWKVYVNGSIYALKTMRKKGIKLLAVRLQDELFKKGVSVPQIIYTKKGASYVTNEERYYFLSQYIEQGATPSLEEQVRSIAKFHQNASLPASLSDYRSRLWDKISEEIWLQEYEIKINEMKQWIKEYKLPDEFKACLDMADACIKLMKKSSLKEHLEIVSDKDIMIHGDFYISNIIKNKSGECYIIDLDDTRIGSPIRDLRKIPIPELVTSSLYDAYFSEFPWGRTDEELYYIDALFPHYLHLQLLVFIQRQTLNSNMDLLRESTRQELNKQQIIKKRLSL